MEDLRYFILVEPDYHRLTTARVVKLVTITRAHAILDYGDPRKIMVYITTPQPNNKDDIEEYDLYFPDRVTAQRVKMRIEECHKNAVLAQVTQLLSYLESCDKDILSS